MSKNVIHWSLAVIGAAALAFGVAADLTAADAQPVGGHAGRAPFATRAESLRLARRLLAKAVLPQGSRRFHGRKLPAGLSAAPEQTSATPLIDVHRIFTERRSMRRITNAYVTYPARHPGAAFSHIEMLVNVVPGRPGHALIRVDIQVVWYRHKPASDYLAARDFLAVRIDDSGDRPHSPRLAQTFRQRAIIDKLARVQAGFCGATASRVDNR